MADDRGFGVGFGLGNEWIQWVIIIFLIIIIFCPSIFSGFGFADPK